MGPVRTAGFTSVLLLMTILMSLSGCAGLHERDRSAHISAPGNAERNALIDGLTAWVKEMHRPDVVFQVEYQRVHGNWAYVRTAPSSPDGRNHYEPVNGLLQRRDGVWKVVAIEPCCAECEDNPQPHCAPVRVRFPEAPADIFPPYEGAVTDVRLFLEIGAGDMKIYDGRRTDGGPMPMPASGWTIGWELLDGDERSVEIGFVADPRWVIAETFEPDGKIRGGPIKTDSGLIGLNLPAVAGTIRFFEPDGTLIGHVRYDPAQWLDFTPETEAPPATTVPGPVKNASLPSLG